jgi:hypothetical protein
MPRNPILVMAESAAEASRYVKQFVNYDFLLLCRREIVEVFGDDLNCIVGLHAKAPLPDPRERVHPSDCASRF